MNPDPASPPRPRPRRWLRVSLRGLMALILALGVGLGWQVNRVRRQRAAVDAVRGAGGRVVYDYQFSTDPSRRLALRKVQDPPGPAWLRRALGDDWFRSAASVTLTKPAPPSVYAAVAELDGLVELTVGRGLVPAASWPALGRLPRLEVLNVDDTGAPAPEPGAGADDAAVAVMARLPALRSLRLARAPVTDAGLGALAGAARLRSLVLGDCPNLSDAGIARLLAAGPPELETFGLYRHPGPVPLTARALAEHHPGLRELGLNQTGVADADLAPLGRLAGLTVLNLGQGAVTDAGLPGLAGLGKLESLNLAMLGVTDAGMASVRRLPALVDLNLAGSRVGDAGLAELEGLPRLATLHLGGTAITPKGIARFSAARPTVKVDARTFARPTPTPPPPPIPAPPPRPPASPEARP